MQTKTLELTGPERSVIVMLVHNYLATSNQDGKDEANAKDAYRKLTGRKWRVRTKRKKW